MLNLNYFKSSLFLLILFLTSCISTIPLSTNYFAEQSTIAIIQVENEINNYRIGSQGLLDIAVTPGKKYIESLSKVDDKVNPQATLFKFYENIFQSKNKNVIVIKDKIKLKSLTLRQNSGKKFAEYDFSFIKDEHPEVNEVLFVDAKHGIMISYYGFIETGKYGYCQINTEIISLEDHSLKYKSNSVGQTDIKGKWKTPPEYTNLKQAIKEAVDMAISKESIQLK